MSSSQPATLHKVTARHLSRQAMLYVRQSTLHQVLENTESTARQYALRERAIALGWEASRIVVIDQDLGQSGASAADREGFQRLVAEVGLGHVGLVMGLEVSRLARSSLDWHHLLEICTMTGTLILDEDGLYDPALFNDRLLLGLKGTMSEAELHVLQARLKGGILNKASRAALKVPLPVGFLYAENQTVMLDPDAQIQQAVRLLFATFKRTGSAWATVKYFRTQGLVFPRRVRSGPHTGELHWMPLQHSTVLKVLRNPRYAGAFCFGRTQTRKHPDGSLHTQTLPQEQWLFLIQEVHPGYISWEDYEANLAQLRANRQAHGEDRRHGPPREGPALLQGLLICGRCGNRMTVHYHDVKSGQRLYPEYLCQKERIERGEDKYCQRLLGAGLDAAMADLLLAQLTPLALETSIQIHEELQAQVQEAQRLRVQQVERARYAAELAQRRFLRVDPENRLVANVLEADWNARLRELAEIQEQAERQQEAEQRKLSAIEQQAIRSLVEDFPRVWKDSRTSDRDRKRMVRWLLEDVTVLRREDVITAHIRFKGGATQTVTVPVGRGRCSSPELIALIDALLEDYTDAEVAVQLNEQGWRTYEGKPFTAARVLSLRRYRRLKDHGTRLAEKGWLKAADAAQAYGICRETLMAWGRAGLLPMSRINDQGTAMFPPPGPQAPRKNAHKFAKTRTRSSCERSAV
ncbi:MAG TPA: recombinase family protein [Ktedonobacteraceae bacterium]|nr:recombinase family protein [Ktedonobacteraceae bacterium]